MLGAVRDRIPVYAMCGWYRENDRDHSQYKRTINDTLEIGYRAFKLKVGRFGLDDDVERIEVGRTSAGRDIRIMVDANQAYNRVEALRRGRAYQELGCFWYEEPLPPWDHEGYAELAQALDMRIATGENEYNKHAFMDLLLKKGADVVQPDNRRAGANRMDGIRSDRRRVRCGTGEPRRRPYQYEHAVRDSQCNLHGIRWETEDCERRGFGARVAGYEQRGVK
jgi:L-alanine-DL-glutamate epimerase-like enolase superfamily enzyme